MKKLKEEKWLYNEFYKNDDQQITMLTTHDPEQHEQYIAKGLLHEGFQVISEGTR